MRMIRYSSGSQKGSSHLANHHDQDQVWYQGREVLLIPHANWNNKWLTFKLVARYIAATTAYQSWIIQKLKNFPAKNLFKNKSNNSSGLSNFKIYESYM